ncbi:MAG: hypothetical protein WKG06_31585 [Segetibacter sp.]
MNNEEKDLNKTNVPISGDAAQERQVETNNTLEDDIIRNDTIPETSKDTPGSNGAFPVGVFDISKD